MTPATRQERLVATLASLIAQPMRDGRPVHHAAVGAASAIPAAACHLLRLSGHKLRISVLHAPRSNPFADGSRELFDLAGQGRIDLFFLGGAQIDGEANLNLVGFGDWPGTTGRMPGNFGAPFVYFAVPRVILFREEHSRRVLVRRVDLVTAPGTSRRGVWRRGSASELVTGRAVFTFDPTRARFTLHALQPGETQASIREATGFDYDEPADVPTLPDPTPAQLASLRGPVRQAIAATYPVFAAGLPEP